MSIEEMIEELTEAVIEAGTEAVSEVLGYECPEEDTDDLTVLLEEAFDQMPEEEIEALYDKYC